MKKCVNLKDYVPCKEHWFEMFTKNFDKPYWIPVKKVPIKKINIVKSVLSFPNEVSKHEVLYMVLNFDKEAWIPITINKDYCLIDGQHRLETAKQLGLNYIDVVIEDTELLKKK